MSWKDGWRQSMQIIEKHGGDDGPGMFLNIADGERVKVVFLKGEPFGRERRWDNIDRRSKFEQEIGNAGELMPNGQPRYERARGTVSYNVYDVDNKTVRIFEANATTARLIFTALDMVDGPGKSVFEIVRRGSQKDTTYSLSKIKNLTEEEQQHLHQVWLNDAHDLRTVQGYQGAAGAATAAPAAVAAVADDFDLF